MRTPIFLALPCVLCLSSAHAGALLKPTSGVTTALQAKNLLVQTRIQGAFAKTLVTTTYDNPNSQPIEADFLYSAPPGARVTSFAYWYRGEKVVARVVEKARAAKIYSYITSRMRDPALVEMVGKNTFRARIFPVDANADLKIEIGLAQELTPVASGALWRWPLREETKGGALQNLRVEVEGAGELKSNLGAFSNGKILFTRRNWKAKDDARVLFPQNPAPLRASLVNLSDGGRDGFFALQIVPDRPIFAPKLSISGIKTYGLVAPKLRRLEAGKPFTVFGRSFGTGRGVVALGGQSVEVEFGANREKNNVASLLWGAATIEELSLKAQNKARVMKLSTRYGMPSLWTSWLAIPEAERQTFKKQMLASERDSAAKSYANAIARGDEKAIGEAKSWFEKSDRELRQVGHDYSSEEELQPLDNYLNEELKRVRRAIVSAKYGEGAGKKDAQKWLGYAKRLEKAGARDGAKGVEMPVYVLEDELRIASRLLAIEIEGGRERGKKARGLRARLEELAQSQVAQNYGWGAETFLAEQAEMRAQNLAMTLATGQKRGTLSRQNERELRARLARLERGADLERGEALRQASEAVFQKEIEAARQQYLVEARAGRPLSPAARRAEKALVKRRGESVRRELRREGQTVRVEELSKAFKAEIVAGRAENGRAQTLRRQLEAMRPENGESGRERIAGVYRELAREKANVLAGQIAAGAPDENLQRTLELYAEKAGARPTDLLQEESQRVRGELARQLSQQLAKNPEDARALELEKRLLALGYQSQRYDGVSDGYLAALEKIADEIFEARTLRGDEETARALEKRFAALEKRAHISFDRTVSSQEAGLLSPSRVADKKRIALFPKVAAGKEETPEAVQLENDLQKIFEVAPDEKKAQIWFHNPAWELDRARRGRAHEAAYQFAKTGGEAERALLEKQAKKAGIAPEKFLAVQRARLEKGEPMLTAEQYRLLPGDPLISVSAPRDCRAVVAVLPDGVVQPLAWNEGKKTWETRFDVPTHAAPGDYAVQILIVAPDGTRRSLALHFNVDTTAPGGKAAILGRTLRLETGSDTDRVSAFLEGGVRVDLRRGSDGAFVGQVPAGETVGRVTFVLTDRAHNRTTLQVAE